MTSETPLEIEIERRGPAAWLWLNRPHKGNALTPEMIAELLDALDRCETAEPDSADGPVRAVVLAGRGDAFCTGADLSRGRELATAPAERNPFARLLQRLQASPLPVVTAVDGAALGGALGLVAAADIVFATPESRFGFSEVRLGLIPAMISVAVLPKLGPHHARRLFLTGRKFGAEDARDYGLVHQVVAASELEHRVRIEAQALAMGGPEALAEAKRLIREIPRLPDDEAYGHASRRFAERVTSEEAREGLKAFAEKRLPSWCR